MPFGKRMDVAGDVAEILAVFAGDLAGIVADAMAPGDIGA